MALLQHLVMAGFKAVWEYIALHTITCLVPAFLLAGAMVTLVSREAIVAHLGATRHRLRAFGLAAGGSLFVAACSCTVIPVASGLYYSGAGIGPAFIVLWVAPAANVLALTYTGALLGGKLALVRLLATLATALAVGAIMTWVFSGEERARHDLAAAADPPGKAVPHDPPAGLVNRGSVIFLGLILVSLLAPNYLVREGPYGYKIAVWVLATVAVAWYAWRWLSVDQRRAWLQETWWFVRIIFPLLLAGVFLVGVISAVLPAAWVERWLGGQSLRASVFATLIGAVSYFATMTEAPFVARLMDMGMGKGPALALLLAGPGLSLPNMLTIGRLFGAKRAAVYITTVVVLASLLGWVAGQWIL